MQIASAPLDLQFDKASTEALFRNVMRNFAPYSVSTPLGVHPMEILPVAPCHDALFSD
jgi:hypothetical protein